MAQKDVVSVPVCGSQRCVVLICPNVNADHLVSAKDVGALGDVFAIVLYV